jgi:hypothetical protein
MLFLRARSARSSRISDASVSLGFRALGIPPPPPACVAVLPARYCEAPCRRFWACACAAEVGFEDSDGSVRCGCGVRGPNQRSWDWIFELYSVMVLCSVELVWSEECGTYVAWCEKRKGEHLASS